LAGLIVKFIAEFEISDEAFGLGNPGNLRFQLWSGVRNQDSEIIIQKRNKFERQLTSTQNTSDYETVVCIRISVKMWFL
jgi:hypothetical protein